MSRRWDELREALQTECFRKSVAEVALEIHCERSTLYRIINGETKNGSGALAFQVEELVARRDRVGRARQDSHLQQAPDTQPS